MTDLEGLGIERTVLQT